MDWIPTNKVTGKQYPPVSDTEKNRMEASPHTQGKYSFAPLKTSKPVTAEEPKKKDPPSKPSSDKVEDPTKTK